MMEYKLRFTPFCKRQLKKLKQKDKILLERLIKKFKEVRRNPEHYKSLKGDFRGLRRVHIDPFVTIFDIKGDLITVHYVKHYDKAY